ncbi:hypothetical protein [Streptomyces sp. NPDC018055]|uniref:hypothetical protein n=1 Tax=Streptomyces sp. NPDC018055 TaxID=3365038 RepID=UPI0037917F41
MTRKRAEETTPKIAKTARPDLATPAAAVVHGSCGHCNGSGWIGDIVCPACNGTGG